MLSIWPHWLGNGIIGNRKWASSDGGNSWFHMKICDVFKKTRNQKKNFFAEKERIRILQLQRRYLIFLFLIVFLSFHFIIEKPLHCYCLNFLNFVYRSCMQEKNKKFLFLFFELTSTYVVIVSIFFVTQSYWKL